MATRNVEYGPYEIVCTATPDGAGGFTPRVAVAISHGDAREETPVQLPGDPAFASEEAALEHAEQAGRDWVDENG